MKLLLDEHLSPRLAAWCAERRGIYAAAVAHIGLSETADQAIWQYAFNHDYVVVTTNAQDFLHLLNVELHPGLIVLRESGLTNVIRDRLPANSTAPKRSIALDMMDNASALPTCPQRQHQKQ